MTWRPTWREYGRNYGHLFLYVALPSLIAIVVSAYLQHGWFAVAPLLLILVLAVGSLALANGVERVSVDAGVLSHRTPFGVTRRWPVGDVAKAAILSDFELQLSRTGPQPPEAARDNLFLYGRDGRRLVRLSGAAWKPAQFEEIVASLPDVRVERFDRPMSTDGLEKLYPGSFTRMELHPFWPSLMIALLLVAVIFVSGFFAIGPSSP